MGISGCAVGCFWKLPVVLAAIAAAAGAQDAVRSWYPLQPGDTWVYAKESLDGEMDHPSVERWTTEETVVRAVPAPEPGGRRITKRVRILDHTAPPGWLNDSTKREVPETHLLVRGNCGIL